MRYGRLSLRVVELLGVPGSGKTTMAKALVESVPGSVSLPGAVHRAVSLGGADQITRLAARITRSPESRLWKAAYARSTDRLAAIQRFIGERPRLIETILEAQRIRASRDIGQDLTLGWLLNLMARYTLAVEWSGANWLVIDEGFAQRCVALLAAGYVDADSPLIDAYVDSAPSPDVLVVIDTPIEVCFDRLEGSGWSERLVDADHETRRAFLEKASVVATHVATRCDRRGSEVIWVSGTTPAPDNTARIATTFHS